jgi:hypothetical protein
MKLIDFGNRLKSLFSPFLARTGFICAMQHILAPVTFHYLSLWPGLTLSMQWSFSNRSNDLSLLVSPTRTGVQSLHAAHFLARGPIAFSYLSLYPGLAFSQYAIDQIWSCKDCQTRGQCKCMQDACFPTTWCACDDCYITSYARGNLYCDWRLHRENNLCQWNLEIKIRLMLAMPQQQTM